MIRSRMSFGRFQELRREVEGKPVLIDPTIYAWPVEEVAACIEDGTFKSVKVSWSPVYSSDPKSPNLKWSLATPSGSVTQFINNPHAVRDICEMIAEAKGPNGRKNGTGQYADTLEFYVDIYPAPAED
jgi:hypothetical protein